MLVVIKSAMTKAQDKVKEYLVVSKSKPTAIKWKQSKYAQNTLLECVNAFRILKILVRRKQRRKQGRKEYLLVSFSFHRLDDNIG